MIPYCCKICAAQCLRRMYHVLMNLKNFMYFVFELIEKKTGSKAHISTCTFLENPCLQFKKNNGY